MDALRSVDWLAANLATVKVIDASYYLPEHARDAAAEFADAHIPGAVLLNLTTLADAASPLPMMLAPPAQIAARFAALGIGAGDAILLYDASPLHSAARAWWSLRMAGFADVAILDGGFAGWRRGGYPVESGTPAVVPAPDPLTGLPLGRVRDLAAMHANLATAAEQVVDARSPARFAGTEPEARAGLIAGHIPGSRNLYYATLFDADGLWKRGEALRDAFAQAGVDPTRPMVATCGSGVTAAVLAFGAHLMGYDMAIYDGSWTEWGSDPATPKAPA